MGWCHEFGCQITTGCNHPMKAGAAACTCAVCDTVCTGRFSGCPEVFARTVAVTAPSRPVASTSVPSGPPPSDPPRPAASRPAVSPPAPAPVPAPGPQPGGVLSRENGARILHWMRAEFDGVKSQLHAVASSLAHQQAVVADLAAHRSGDMNRALAELEGSADQLRTEASRMRRDAGGLQEDGAELRRESARLREMERDMAERLPQVVAEAVQPELRAALREVEAITAGLREEASQLRAIRDGLNDQLPRLVEAAVREAMANFTPQQGAPGGARSSPSKSAPEANGFAGETPPAGIGATGVGGALADEPTEEAVPSAFGAPPAARPAPVAAADGGVGEDPLACSLPGLVVGPSLALGVSEALRRAGLRRRRRRRANRPSPGLHRRDPFATQLTRRIDRYGRARADLAAVRPSGPGSSAKGPATPPSTVAIGFRDAEEVALDLAETGTLALLGPAAADVARFLATSFLAHAGPAGGEAVVVGDLLPPAQAFPGLSQPKDVGTALARLAEEREGNRSGVPVLVVAREASPEDLEALARLRSEQDGRAVLAVLVDTAPQGASILRLEANERVTDAGEEGSSLATRLAGARLYTLGREAASELLAVLASARTDDDVVTAVVEQAEPFEVTVAESPSVSVQLLGTYRIDVAGVEIRAGLRAKARELLAFYLLHPAGTTLDAAVEALWPEADPGRGSEWFWTALGNLRSRLRDATGEKKLKVIERDGDRYRVEPLFDVDLWRLEQALSDGATGAEAARAAAYDRVAQIYTGDLLAGADWAWAETPREDLRQRVLDVLVWLGDVRWASGDARGSWQALQRAVEVDPYAEQIYRRIMRLQSKLGRPDDAAATFRRLQARLVEIDLEPTPESEKLFAELCATG
ncbi:MAG TPA: BTAD domain-containing putative transcriptional regulator [Acidimicrobiales bacterium]|nr:BTAD domain-containing putative transcriptional regulator [Acidimicrobiales bacterium]